MMWILMCCIALFVGFMLYSSIEDKLPSEFDFLKGIPKLGNQIGKAPQTAPANGAANPGADNVISSSHAWQVRGDGKNVELIRDFQSRIEVNGQRYDAPTLVLTCFDGELFARVNLRMAVASTGSKAVVGTATGPQQWSLGQDNNIYSPFPKTVFAAVRQEKTFDLALPYAELGTQSATFNSAGGAKALKALPAGCQ